MEYSQNIKGQERYSQARSVDKNFQGTETLNSFRNSNQFGRGLGPDPKRVSVTKAAPNDTKLEGFSIPKNKPPGQTFSAPIAKGIENDFINNLQQQIYLSELEIKMLKDQENARANKFMGGLEAGPLTENLVMLKGKYKKIEEDLQSKINELTHENRELMAKNNTSNINYSRFLEDIKDFEFKLLSERDYFDKETEKYRKAISTATFLKEENTKNLSDVSKARDTAKAYTGETRIKIERQASLLISLEEKLSQAEAFKNKIIDEKNKQILALKDKIFQLKDDLKNNSTLGIVQEKLTFLSANKQEVEMERDNLVNRIKTLKQSKNLIEKASTQLTVEKRGLIKDIEECKMNIEREKSQQETILTQKLKQKEEKELSFNLNQLEDIRSENEHTMETLKVIMSTNTDLSEERTRLYYDIEEIKEKKDLLNKDFNGLKNHCIELEADLKDVQTKIKVIDERNKEIAMDIENKVTNMRKQLQENQEFKEKLEYLKKKVELNEQLKNIDLEELKTLSRSNLLMNNTITDLITKWEGLQERKGK